MFQTLLLFLKVRAHLTHITFAFFRVFLKETVPQFNHCFRNKWCCQRFLLLLDSAHDAIICFWLPERIRGTLSRCKSQFKGLFDMSEPTWRYHVPSFTESAVDSIEDRATAESDWQCALYHGGSRTSGIRAGNQTAKQKKRYMLYSHLKWIYNYYFALSKRTSRSRSKKHDRGLKASMLRVS